MTNQEFNFSESMKKIEAINEWFENEDLDLEEALSKLREGKTLIKSCKSRLEEIENEFNELKIDFSEESGPEQELDAKQMKTQVYPDDSGLPF